MNGAHDMGGMHGFGPVHLEADEPLFHAPWERRAMGLTVAMGATGAREPAARRLPGL
jgi:nitrile hydratase